MKIVQFSPGRTGSTLIWNILKSFYPNIPKQHNLVYNPNLKIIATIRDPRDIVASRLLVYNKVINIESIKLCINQMKIYGLNQLINIMDKDNILILRYESFWNDYDYIFDKLETFLDISIPDDKREEIQRMYNTDKMSYIADKYNNFKNFDKITQIHGNHISSRKGEPGSWKVVIPKEYHQFLEEELKSYIDIFNYS